MRVIGGFVFACAVVSLVVVPVAAKVKGVKTLKHHRYLKGDSKDGGKSGDDGGDLPGLPDIPDLGDVCFSDKATVQVQHASDPVSMKDLSVGDYVLTNDGSYQQVYAWGHYNPTKEATFHQLYTSSSSEDNNNNNNNNNKPLELTGQHLVYLAGKANPVRADSVEVGDLLHTSTTGAKVIKIRQITRQGVYTPLTTTGKLVVDNIHASSYISLQSAPEYIQVQGINMPMAQQDFVHIVLSPFRMMCLGLPSSSLCQSANKEGIPHYIDNGMQFIRWADETQPLWIQIIILTLAFVLYGSVMVLENTVGASRAPTVLVVAGVVYALMKVHGVSIRARKVKST